MLMDKSTPPPPPPPVAVFRGHSDSVNCVAFSEPGSHLASGDLNGCFFLWDIASRRPVANAVVHTASILSISVLGDAYVTSSRDGSLRHVKVDAGSCNLSVERDYPTGARHFCNSSAVHSLPNVVASPCGDETKILVWDTRCEDPVAHIQCEKQFGMTSSIQLIDDLHPVSSALEHNEEDNNECKTPTTSLVNDTEPVVSNTSIAVGFEDGSLSVFDMRVLGALNTVKALDHSPLMCMDYCAKRKELLVAGANHQMKVFKCAYPEGYPEEGSSVIPATVNISMRSEIKMKKQGTAAVKYRHDGRILVSGHWDSTVKVYDCKRMKPLAVLRHHRESVYGIDFCSRGPNRGMFASGSKDCSIALWDLFSDTILTE